MTTDTDTRDYALCSGEGERGTLELVHTTPAGILARLRAERAGGDRWARATEIRDGERVDAADGRGLLLGETID